MSEFRGTKGKWKVRDNKFDIITKEKGLIMTCYMGRSVYEAIEEEEAQANAQLIAHAHEMLEMLQYFVRENMLSIAGEEMAEQLIQKATTPCETK